jgi:hypothetical protein
MNWVKNIFDKVIYVDALINKNIAHVNSYSVPKEDNHDFRVVNQLTQHFGNICIGRKSEFLMNREIGKSRFVHSEDEISNEIVWRRVIPPIIDNFVVRDNIIASPIICVE